MRDLRECIDRAVRAGGLDPERARQVLDDYNQALNDLSTRMAPSQAQVEAARRVVAAVSREAKERRRVAGLQASAAARNVARVVNDPRSPEAALKDLINAPTGARGETLVGKTEAVRRELRRGLTRFVKKHRANLLGKRRNKASLDNFVDEVFGRNTGDAEARAFAKAWADASEAARLRFNAAGGRIGKRADWGMPQAHDPRAIAKAGFDEWRAHILPRLDTARMIDESTGLPFTPASLEVRMREAYDAILSDGWSRREPTGRAGGTAAYNRHVDHRFFIFRDAPAWREYQGRFGHGDAFRVVIGHLDHMAREIAEMEVLGPNPVVGLEHLKQATVQQAARRGGPKGIERATSAASTAQDMFDMHRGLSNRPGNRAFAQAASSVRQYLVSAQLGSAFLSSVTDFGSSAVAARFAGLRTSGPLRMVARLLASPELRAQAAEAGLILENAVDMGHAAGRFMMEDFHVETAARLGDFTIRASGLGVMTEVQRQAFGLEFMRALAAEGGKAFADLDPKFRRALTHWGIDEADWNVVRTIRPHDAGGLTILRPGDVAAAGHQGLADRLMEMIVASSEIAVPTSSLRGRAAALGSTRPGTIAGEVVRGLLQFKAFPITVLVGQARRITDVTREAGAVSALRYAAGFFTTMTVLGALAVQLKETSKGKDPRKMDSPEFWMSAAAQGGGLGLFGDFFLADLNRFGMSPWEQLAGPQIGFLADFSRLTIGNAQQLATGQDTEIANDMLKFARRFTPGGSLWYLRLAYEREILDQVQKMTDPKSYKRLRSRERAAKDFGTQFYWRPGASLLQGDRVRPPDLANALGDRR